VDKEAGISVVFYTQVLPFFDKNARAVLKEFETLVYKK